MKEKELLEKRRAAKARLKEWWDRPEHRPTKDEDDRTRTDRVPVDDPIEEEDE